MQLSDVTQLVQRYTSESYVVPLAGTPTHASWPALLRYSRIRAVITMQRLCHCVPTVARVSEPFSEWRPIG